MQWLCRCGTHFVIKSDNQVDEKGFMCDECWQNYMKIKLFQIERDKREKDSNR